MSSSNSASGTSGSASQPQGGSEYVGGDKPNYTHGSSADTTGGAAVSGNLVASAQSDVPVTDNSDVPYKPEDYNTMKPTTDSDSVDRK